LRLLLDTHIWLWALLEPQRLGTSVTPQIQDPANELWLSPISVWELLLLAEWGRVELDDLPERWVEKAFREFPLRDAGLTRDVALTSRSVELPHEDPADRFIAATAVVYDLTLVSADRRLWNSKAFDVLPNQ